MKAKILKSNNVHALKSHTVPNIQKTFRSYRKATECTFGKNQYATPDTIRKTATLSKKLQTKSGARCLPETYSEKIGRTQFLEMHTIPEKAGHMRPGTRKSLKEIQVDPTTGRP